MPDLKATAGGGSEWEPAGGLQPGKVGLRRRDNDNPDPGRRDDLGHCRNAACANAFKRTLRQMHCVGLRGTFRPEIASF